MKWGHITRGSDVFAQCYDAAGNRLLVSSDDPQALALLQASLSVATATGDAREGVAAFVEKRTPAWGGSRTL